MFDIFGVMKILYILGVETKIMIWVTPSLSR